MTTNEVAKELGVTQSLVRRRIREGQIRAEMEKHPRGDIYWITESALQEYRLKYGQTGEPQKRGPGRPRKT